MQTKIIISVVSILCLVVNENRFLDYLTDFKGVIVKELITVKECKMKTEDSFVFYFKILSTNRWYELQRY